MKEKLVRVIQDAKSFGCFYEISSIFRRLFRGNSITDDGLRAHDELVLKYIAKSCPRSVSMLHNMSEQVIKHPTPKVIWVLWLQGIEDAPPIVKACYKRLQEFYGAEYRIVLLNSENLDEYVHLSDTVMEKYRSGAITRTHLSDIIRFRLLSERGGIWIDSTIYFTGRTPLDAPLVTLHAYDKDSRFISKLRWTSNFIGGAKENPLFVCMDSFMNEYWENNSKPIDYLLLDYCIYLCYRESGIIRNTIDSLPNNHFGIFELQNALNMPYNMTKFNAITAKTNVHKLSWKGEYTDAIQDIPTLYQMLIEGKL